MASVSRTLLLDATRRAGEVLNEFDIRKRLQNGYTRIDPVEIAEQAGVAVMLQPLQKLLGAYIDAGRPGIMVNAERPVGLVHMTCAHELGHFFLNHAPSADYKINDIYGDPNEQQADMFAYSLLAPLWLVQQVAKRKKWGKSAISDPAVIYQLSLRLGASFTSMVWTLFRYNILTKAQAEEISDIKPIKIKQHILGNAKLTNSNADVWVLDKADQDTIIEPHADDTFLISLPDNSGAGYVWNLDDLSSHGFQAKPLLNDAIRIPAKQHFDKDAQIGSHSNATLIISRFDNTAVTEDQVHMSLVNHRPWEKPSTSNEHCHFRAEYEELFRGVDKAERQRLLDDARAVE